MFNEADRRDPDRQLAWIALVDGNNHQIDQIKTEARKRNVKIPIVVDFIHVLDPSRRETNAFQALRTRPGRRPEP